MGNPKFQLMLAPMEGITDNDLRTLCYRNGADLTFTEMARVDNLAHQKKGELSKILIIGNTPTQIQLAGARLEEYERFLKCFTAPEGFCGFNLNLGCPSPYFIRQGLGAAMIKRISRVNEIVKLINKSGFDCSIKLRLGLNDFEKGKGAYLNLIRKVDASFFAVHARTAKQTERDPADTSVYEGCVATEKRIVANGDIRTKAQVDELNGMGLYGAMIGRAAVENPGIFNELKTGEANSTPASHKPGMDNLSWNG